MSEDLKAGDWVRRTIHARFETRWCEGQICLMSGGVSVMTVARAHNWPAAEGAMRDGSLFHPHPHGVGTLKRIPPDILVGDHVTWTPPSDCPYYGLHLKGLVTAVVNDRPLIRVQALYDSHFREIAIAEWPPNLRLEAVMDTGVAPGIVQRWPRLSEVSPATASDTIPLKAGDYVRWDNPLFPAGRVWIEGELVLNPVNHARIRIDDFRGQGSEWSRGAHTDVRVEPGSLRRIPRPGVGLRPQREPMRDEMIKERYAEPGPLDVEYDGVRLRDLLNAQRQHDQGGYRVTLTAEQRAAISAYWSADLRAKIAASTERERNRVRVDLQDID
jgi:transposase